jgi:hypothetical protein
MTEKANLKSDLPKTYKNTHHPCKWKITVSYTLPSTTNLSAPITLTTNTTGVLDGTGSFSNAIPINSLQNDSFFRVRIP